MTNTNTGWLSPLRRRAGRSRKDGVKKDWLGSKPKPNVNEEYLKALRTKSYLEISSKAQGASISSCSLSRSCMHLTEQLLEPRQEIIADMINRLKVHHLVEDYFKASLDACRCCDTILQGIHQMRLAYGRVTDFVNLSQSVLHGTHFDDQTHKAMCRDLSSFALQNNPLSLISPLNFRDVHDRSVLLLRRLNSKRARIRRRLRIKRVCKNVGVVIMTSHTALVVALQLFAFHSIVGLVAAPCIVGALFGLIVRKTKFRRSRERFSKSSYTRQHEQLDVAAKGVYILINDLDTMSRMVRRLHDEVEHRRRVARICVKNATCEILKQVEGEFLDHESNFLDQLEELEEHVYLSFLTINRCRRLVMQKITEKQHYKLLSCFRKSF